VGTNEHDRRKFLWTSLLSGAGALLASPAIAAASREIKSESKEKPVITRTLGKTGIVVPIVSFGVMRADSPALVQAAMKEGMVLFDTAHGYQGGKNEEMLGEIFKDVPRSSFVIATKVKPDGDDAAAAKTFLEKFDLSLKRLKLDSVDILYVHAVASRDDVLAPAILEAVQAAKKSGKAKHIGVSTHKNEPAVIHAVIESGVYEVVLTSINFKQAHYPELKMAISVAAKAGIGIVAMKTMAGGFHDKDRKQPINCRAALKFVMQDENIATSIPGITNFDQLAMNVGVNRDLTLTKEEAADLTVGKSQGGLYCQGCEQCVPNCPKGLPIPEIMRAYMYAYGYRESRLAHALLSDLNVSEHPCTGCSHCSVVCAKNFAVPERITDVARLLSVPEEFLV
jgi:predicted aldo/keto reductase-like oxidoreductase